MTTTTQIQPVSRRSAARFVRRVIDFIRPRPRYLPLTVEEILKSDKSRSIVDSFNDLYYSGGTARSLNWRGSEMIKTPCDLWVMVELMQSLSPSVIVETGTHRGGSASFFADIARLLNLSCRVITVDHNPKWAFEPETKGICSVVGYSTDPATFKKVENEVRSQLRQFPGPVIVLLDSDHSEANVTAELKLYSRLVSVGSYLVVEDTNVNGHPSFAAHGPGPWEAVQAFLGRSSDFVVDAECQRYLLTLNPGGWLKRVSQADGPVDFEL
jgi:cephalosporin hydroxylase